MLAGAFVVVAVIPSALNADTYHSLSHGYTVEGPPGWTQVSADVLARAESAAFRQTEKSPTWEVAFAIGRETRLTFPYLIVQVQPNSRYGLQRQFTRAEIDSIVTQFAGFDTNQLLKEGGTESSRSVVTKSGPIEFVSRSDDGLRHRFRIKSAVAGATEVHSKMMMIFGRKSVVSLLFYTRADDSDRFASVFDQVCDSFVFDAGSEYAFVPESAPGAGIPTMLGPFNSQPSGGIDSPSLSDPRVLGIFVLVGVLFGYSRSRPKKKVGDAPSTSPPDQSSPLN